MEKNLSRYITRECEKLGSKEQQHNFIENFRFLMMSNDRDFQNFYTKKGENDHEFYSIVDTLYQLNNFMDVIRICTYPQIISNLSTTYHLKVMGL